MLFIYVGMYLCNNLCLARLLYLVCELQYGVSTATRQALESPSGGEFSNYAIKAFHSFKCTAPRVYTLIGMP